METSTATQLDVQKVVTDVLNTIEKEREREIISRRFGLNDRKETLEEIGNLLGITRERVRQIEKQVVTRLSEMNYPQFSDIRELFTSVLESLGRVAPVSDVAAKVGAEGQTGQSQVSFLARLMPEFVVIYENDDFHHSIAIKSYHDEKRLAQLVVELIETVKTIAKPVNISVIQKKMPTQLDVSHVEGLARSAKNLTTLEGKWGLMSWPLVNPKSIRDKIYVILQKNTKPMHFSEIAEAIKNSNFKRKDVTTQAIHNELIKDGRFVLVGRGIYALAEWGYSQGTVADVIEGILKAESPLHRDEIVARVLDQRQVKSTTIILNLQGKKQFKRVAKATYALAD